MTYSQDSTVYNAVRTLQCAMMYSQYATVCNNILSEATVCNDILSEATVCNDILSGHYSVQWRTLRTLQCAMTYSQDATVCNDVLSGCYSVQWRTLRMLLCAMLCSEWSRLWVQDVVPCLWMSPDVWKHRNNWTACIQYIHVQVLGLSDSFLLRHVPGCELNSHSFTALQNLTFIAPVCSMCMCVGMFGDFINHRCEETFVAGRIHARVLTEYTSHIFRKHFHIYTDIIFSAIWQVIYNLGVI